MGILGYTRVYNRYTRAYEGIHGYTRVNNGIHGYTRVYNGYTVGIQGYT